MSEQDWAEKAANEIVCDLEKLYGSMYSGATRKEWVTKYANIIRSTPSSDLVGAAQQLDSYLAIEPVLSTVDGLVTEWNCKCCAAVLNAEYVSDPSNKIFRVRLTNGPHQLKHKPDCDWMALRSALSGVENGELKELGYCLVTQGASVPHSIIYESINAALEDSMIEDEVYKLFGREVTDEELGGGEIKLKENGG